ncbi:BZ3500_MvSof-1268-A1-R1_Chr2-1g04336 [Microbotryum saponariae]|uniref:BZ3500_MvSof-1268-A1-R1_Chr2-1g04336 protein n=1 Tax=Microbotryum saponariae TaxID=289078 RepID=A0A2X0MH99_9BASI|nr:BZ3500_MvSof-1268-A1-R1_Chr2-1g04336 [Microbotryum saponariae]SCZ91474.1 BZ3501_MvSof-1269-A2-R1_Chr2-1g03992 [Microbotryum saponariae]
MPRVKRSASASALVNDDDASKSFSSNSTSHRGAASSPYARPTASPQRRASRRTTSPSKRSTRKNPAQDDDHHTTETSPRRSTRRRTMLVEHSQDDGDRSSSLEVLEPAAIAATTTRGKPTLSASPSTTLEQDDLATNSVTHNDDSITTDITEPEPEPAKSEVIAADLKGKNKASSQTSTTSDRGQDDMISKAEVRLREKMKANNTFIDQQAELLRQLTQFTDSLRATAQCGICLQTMKAPHALECGHVFCRQCLINCFFSANNGDDDDDEEEADQDNEENLSRSGSNSHTDSDSSDSGLEGNDASIQSFWEADQPPTPPEGMETIRLTVGNRSFQMNRPEPGYRPAPATAEDSAGRFVELGSDDDDDEQGFGVIGAARERIPSVERIERAVSLRHRSPRENDSTSPPTSPGRAPTAGARTEDRIIIADEEVHHAGPVPPMAHPRPHPSNVICPSCRTKVDTAPKRIFALTDLAHRIRQAEQEGLIGDLDESAPPKSDANKADEMEVTIDEHDKTWGGLFMELDVGGNTNGRTRVARDRDDGVRRCPECSWEIIEATGECAHCQRVYELSSDEDFQGRHYDGGAESDDEGSEISVRSMPRHGVRRPREEEEEEEQPNSEDEAFIDDAPIRKRRRTDGEGSSRRKRKKSEVASSDEESRLGSTSDAALSLSSGSDGDSDSDSESAVSTSSSRYSDSTQKSSEASFPDEGRDATKRRRKARREARRAEGEKERRRGRGKGKELSEVEDEDEDEDESVIIEEEGHESPRKAAAKAAIRRAEKKGSGEEVTETSAKASTSTSTSTNVDKASKEKRARKGWRKLPKITHWDDEDE